MGAETTAETEEAETVEVAPTAAKVPKVVKAVKLLATEAPSTQIFPLAIGQDVDYIINMGKGLIFVLNPPPVPGRIFIACCYLGHSSLGPFISWTIS